MTTKLESIFWKQSEQRLRAGWRLALFLSAFFFLLAAMNFLLILAGLITPLILGEVVTEVEEFLYSPILLLLSAMIGIMAAVPTVYVFGRWIDRRKFSDFGLKLNLNWWFDLFFGLALGAGLMWMIFLVQKQLGWLNTVPNYITLGWGNFYRYILRGLFLFICVGFYEELVFRGYFLKNLSEGFKNSRLSARTAVAISLAVTSVFFGIAHATNPNATLISTVNIAIAGIFLGLGMLFTSSLAIPIGLHITWNFFQGNVFGFPVSGTNAGLTFINIEQLGPERWTGGPFGPEAGYIGLIAMVIGSLLTYFYLSIRYGKLRIDEKIAIFVPHNPAREKKEILQ